MPQFFDFISSHWTVTMICLFYRVLFQSLLIVNRRLDEWVKLDQLDLSSVETVVDEKVEDKVIFVIANFLAFYLVIKYIFMC